MLLTCIITVVIFFSILALSDEPLIAFVTAGIAGSATYGLVAYEGDQAQINIMAEQCVFDITAEDGWSDMRVASLKQAAEENIEASVLNGGLHKYASSQCFETLKRRAASVTIAE